MTPRRVLAQVLESTAGLRLDHWIVRDGRSVAVWIRPPGDRSRYVLVESSGGLVTVTEWARGCASVAFVTRPVPGLTLEERLEDSLIWLLVESPRQDRAKSPETARGAIDTTGDGSRAVNPDPGRRAGEGP